MNVSVLSPKVLTALALMLVSVFHLVYASDKDDHDHDDDDGVTITMMEVGDHHGNLIPRLNLRPGDGVKHSEGGLARMASVIKKTRKRDPQALLFTAGDTLQGSAEVLHTSGQAIVDVLDTFDINAYAPGNWDWMYGKDRAIELFGKGRWGVTAANAYHADTGERVFPAYRILRVKGVKIGVIGMTSSRGLPAVPTANIGLTFTDGEEELVEAIDILRNQEHVDIVVLLSELGLAANTLLVDRHAGVDVVFSSDMHEETPELVVTPVNKVLAMEIGWGGSRLAKIELKVKGGKIVEHDYEWIALTEKIKEDADTAKKVREVRAPFLSGEDFVPHVNPLNAAVLDRPIDTPVGFTRQVLYRANFSDHAYLPAVIEGSSHDFITDAFRTQAHTDIGTLRGFRYGTYLRPGPITRADLYTYLNAGAQIASGNVPGQQIKTILENNIQGTLQKDPLTWSGGWIFAFSGLRYDIDLSLPLGQRARDVHVLRQSTGVWEPLDVNQRYTIAGYYFDVAPDRIGAFRDVSNVQVIRHENGAHKDAVDVVTDYLMHHSANPQTGRIRTLQALPAPVFGNPEMQPLRGALQD